MARKILIYLNISLGATLAIQALFHPGLNANIRLVYMIVAIVFVNTAIFSNLAYTAAMSESSFSFFSRKYRQLPKQEAINAQSYDESPPLCSSCWDCCVTCSFLITNQLPDLGDRDCNWYLVDRFCLSMEA